MKNWEDVGLRLFNRNVEFIDFDRPVKRWGLSWNDKIILPAHFEKISGPWGNPGWAGGCFFGLYHEDGRVGIGYVNVPCDGTVNVNYFDPKEYPGVIRVTWFGNGLMLLKDGSERIVGQIYVSELVKRIKWPNFFHDNC